MKKILLVLAAGFIFLSVPKSTKALETGLPFGGYVTVTIPCSCSVGSWVYYTPFWAGSDVPTAGALYLPPGAPIFQFFVPGLPTSYDLGSYAPGVSACLILAPDPADPCLPLPALGTIEYMGTSILGASPVPIIP